MSVFGKASNSDIKIVEEMRSIAIARATVALAPGSLLVMAGPRTQELFLHRLPMEPRTSTDDPPELGRLDAERV